MIDSLNMGSKGGGHSFPSIPNKIRPCSYVVVFAFAGRRGVMRSSEVHYGCVWRPDVVFSLVRAYGVTVKGDGDGVSHVTELRRIPTESKNNIILLTVAQRLWTRVVSPYFYFTYFFHFFSHYFRFDASSMLVLPVQRLLTASDEDSETLPVETKNDDRRKKNHLPNALRWEKDTWFSLIEKKFEEQVYSYSCNSFHPDILYGI
jgi:hypothetical protein